MPATANVAIDTILERVRDSEGRFHPRPLVLRLLSHCQRVVNAGLRQVLDSATLSTRPRKLFYTLSAELPNAVSISHIEDGARLLDRTDLDTMNLAYPRWPRQLAESHRFWGTAGRDLFFLWPGVERVVSLTVTYVKLLDELTAESATLELPDEHFPRLYDMTEALLHLRARSFDQLPVPLARMGLEAPRDGAG